MLTMLAVCIINDGEDGVMSDDLHTISNDSKETKAVLALILPIAPFTTMLLSFEKCLKNNDGNNAESYIDYAELHILAVNISDLL